MPGADTDEPVRRGRGRPRDPRTDGRITSAAAELMLEHGFDKTTVDEVAARAAVGKATVYRRWRSKEDLAVAAMESLFASEMPEPDTGTIRGDLTVSYRQALEFVNSPAGARFVRMSVSESIRDDRISALYRSSVERREEHSRRTLQRGIDRGEVRADVDIDAAVQWLGGMITARAVIGREFPPVADAERLVDFTLRGICT